MKINKSGVLFYLFLLIGTVVSAQTPDEIIEKYFKAVGGKELLGKMTSLYTESKMEIMGDPTTQKITIINGKGYRQDLELMGSSITTCYTEKGGWILSKITGDTEPVPMNDAQFNLGKEEIYIGGSLFNYAGKGYKAELMGNEAVGSVNAFKIKLTAPDNTAAIYFFDPETGYLLKANKKQFVQGQLTDVSITYSDYRQTDGFILPYRVSSDVGGMYELTGYVTDVRINFNPDPAILTKP